MTYFKGRMILVYLTKSFSPMSFDIAYQNSGCSTRQYTLTKHIIFLQTKKSTILLIDFVSVVRTDSLLVRMTGIEPARR